MGGEHEAREEVDVDATEVQPDYAERLGQVVAAMDALPRGARARAGFDLQLAPTIVTNVLKGHIQREDVLENLERWLETTTMEDFARGRSTMVQKTAALRAYLDATFESEPNALLDADDAYARYVGSVPSHQRVGKWLFVIEMRSRWSQLRVEGKQMFAGVRERDA